MKRRTFLILSALGLFPERLSTAQRRAAETGNIRSSWSNLRLWYRQPAKNWNEALPIGNGRLAAMIFGGTESEKFNSTKRLFGQVKDETDLTRRLQKTSAK